MIKVCLMAFILLAPAVKPPAAENLLAGGGLVDALRQGGYTIYFRHTATDWSGEDQVIAEGYWKSCDPGKMRQLSDAGRAQARRIGRPFGT